MLKFTLILHLKVGNVRNLRADNRGRSGERKNGRRSRSTLRFTLKAARIEALSDYAHERAPFLPDWTKLWGYAPGGGLRPKNKQTLRTARQVCSTTAPQHSTTAAIEHDATLGNTEPGIQLGALCKRWHPACRACPRWCCQAQAAACCQLAVSRSLCLQRLMHTPRR
jgi:hypothetical protein